MFRFLSFLPDRLTRITSGGRFIAEIDGLRFLAIFPVLIQHMSERLQAHSTVPFANIGADPAAFTASRGFIGVYLFFVISGLVLALPFGAHYLKAAGPVPLKNYFWRRLTRLEPPYIILMTIFFLILVFVRSAPFGDLFPHYLASIFYLHNIIYESYTPINPVAWSLEIEVQFYLLAPLLAAVFFRIKNTTIRRLVLTGVILVVLLLQQYYMLYDKPWKFTIVGNLHLFLGGFLLADFYLINWKNGIRHSRLWDFLLLFFLPLPFFVWSHDFLNWMVFPFLLLLLIIGIFKGVYFNHFFTNKWITAIGGMCYTIYLVHLPFAELMIRLTRSINVGDSFFLNLLVQLLIYLPSVFAVSVLFFLALEKPCMDKNWPAKLRESIRKFVFRLRTT